MIAGQILTRTQGPGSGQRPGMVTVAIVGPLQVPEGHPLDAEGHQMVIHSQGESPGHHGDFTIFYTQEMEDHSERIRGSSLGHILTMPIWRRPE